MPAFREQQSQMTILNQLPRAGGCFDRRNGGLATGERAWALLSEQNKSKNDRDAVHSRLENGDDRVLQVGQAVSVNFGHRRMSANVVREIPCSRKVEVCLHDGIRVVVDQHDVEIMQNTEEYRNTSQMMKGIAGNQTAPLIIDIPNETYVTNTLLAFIKQIDNNSIPTYSYFFSTCSNTSNCSIEHSQQLQRTFKTVPLNILRHSIEHSCILKNTLVIP